MDVVPAVGLSDDEVVARRLRYGRNELETTASRPWWPVLARQFTGPLTVILLVATVVSFAIGEHLDAVVIAVIIVVNGLLGFVQEWKAGNAIEALEALLVLRATVRRNGRLVEIDAAELVPGDIVELEPGDKVPADIRLTTSVGLVADESALTGESTGVHKSLDPVPGGAPIAERFSVAHMGTQIVAGAAVGVVVATGRDTELGTIVELTGTAEVQDVPLQQTLAVMARRLGEAALVIAAGTVMIGLLAGRDFEEMFLIGVSLAVAVVPEGLPAVVTVTLAIGIRTMSKRHALLRHLEAAETLGAASVICTDKTGTLTVNRMEAREIWTSDGQIVVADTFAAGAAVPTGTSLAALLETAQLCNKAQVESSQVGHSAARDERDLDERAVGDPIEVALLLLARKLGAPEPAGVRQSEVPFDSAVKMMSVTVRDGDQCVTHVKGAPEVVLGRCSSVLVDGEERPLDDAERSRSLEAQRTMSESGLRTLAMAREDQDDGAGLVFLGMVGMLDPPRPEVAGAVSRALAAGITVVVMTGDAGGTALSVAKQVGLPANRVITGPELDALDDSTLATFLDGSSVLARVSPAHKMRVVRLLQAEGAVVAMTGDGVNDAPALEQASIGIAMGRRGTDVARGAADLVLADDNFASIVAAIEEGRRQYANIQKFIRYLLSSNLGEVIAVSGCVALGWPLVLLPAQILWMNLLTDGVTALALGVEPAEADTMNRPPRDPATSLLSRDGVWWIAGLGVLVGLTTLAVFRLSLGSGVGADLIRAQTLAFTSMVLLETVNVFNFRTERAAIWGTGWRTNPWLLWAAAGALALQVAAVHVGWLANALGTTGLSATEWLTLTVLAVPILVAGELVKAWLRRRSSSGSAPRPITGRRSARS